MFLISSNSKYIAYFMFIDYYLNYIFMLLNLFINSPFINKYSSDLIVIFITKKHIKPNTVHIIKVLKLLK